MELINEKAEQYVSEFTSPQDEVLQQIEVKTLAAHPHAQMLSGHVQGSILSMLSNMIKPRRILEIGTFTGFSALCLAKGLVYDGILHTIEIREEDGATAAAYFLKTNAGDKIKLHIGNALQIIPTMQDAYDKIAGLQYGFGTFIAGPSKTADIEQSLVIGAHGCRTLEVFLTP